MVQPVYMFGKSSNYTFGAIAGQNATITIKDEYTDQMLTYYNQIVVEGLERNPGDSGALGMT